MAARIVMGTARHAGGAWCDVGGGMVPSCIRALGLARTEVSQSQDHMACHLRLMRRRVPERGRRCMATSIQARVVVVVVVVVRMSFGGVVVGNARGARPLAQ